MNDTTPEDYPLVSAIMLAGRHPIKDVLAAIACFRAQTYPYKELIIVNNAANQFDASALNIKAERGIFIVDTPYPFFAGMARNYGIAAANGKILAQFDADYWHAPGRLEAQIATLAEHEGHVAVLASTLSYSYVSGRASYNTNDRGAILGTMVFVRPQNIDYPNIDKQEEHGILDKFQKANLDVISLPAPTLACKLHLGGDVIKPANVGLSKQDFTLVKKILKDRRQFSSNG
jgi:glycosyltransferase involved in cell wall biosynthesis